ncbi:MAG: peptidylprolyl isomerase [Acidimicrobiia bacterium]|nr:peptidylprolyl isomerase [Acidimicrobiia bacterium]
MGTDKRERQKANKAMRQQEENRAETRRKGLRYALIGVGALVAVIALVFIASRVTDDSGDDAALDTSNLEGDADASADGATDATDTADTAATTVATTVAADPADCPPVEGTDTAQQTFDGPPPFCLEPGVQYDAIVETNMGEFTIALDQEQAPNTANNFVFLSRNLYYDDTTCHRIIPEFVVQCGDPTGTGTGGPGYTFADELPAEGEYQIGSVAMANSGPDTNGSQFFVVTGDQGAALPPSWSLFGEVIDGFDTTVLAMEAAGSSSGEPTEPVEIISVTIVER